MQLTPRDRNILIWINAMGFVEIPHIMAKFNMSQNATYKRIKKLKQHDFLTKKSIFHQHPSSYRLTPKAVIAIDDLLPPLKTIALATYRHHSLVATLSIKLEQKFKAEFISERHLRQQAGLKGVGQSSHVSDGALIFSEKKIAIEVELTTKGKRRLEKIYTHHLKNLAFNEVWYFCANKAVERQLLSWQEKNNFIKIYLLAPFLKDEIS